MAESENIELCGHAAFTTSPFKIFFRADIRHRSSAKSDNIEIDKKADGEDKSCELVMRSE
ncbi:MAG: hypothetical protein ACKVSF_10215 [Alphaproteobacteria bacterium]